MSASQLCATTFASIWQKLCARWREPAHPAMAQQSGARAEALAERFLRDRGVRILARNFRCRGGELDLIGDHAGTIVFVEVRLRQREDYGGAAASITPIKQHRVIRAARTWLASGGRNFTRRPMRFDALLLTSLDATQIEWQQAAFSAE